MSQPFSSELVAARRNASFLTNNDHEIEIPLRVSGRLPHPAVLPDVGIIAQRAAAHAVQGRVGELIQKNGLGGLIKKHGLGGLLGGLGGGDSPTPAQARVRLVVRAVQAACPTPSRVCSINLCSSITMAKRAATYGKSETSVTRRACEPSTLCETERSRAKGSATCASKFESAASGLHELAIKLSF